MSTRCHPGLAIVNRLPQAEPEAVMHVARQMLGRVVVLTYVNQEGPLGPVWSLENMEWVTLLSGRRVPVSGWEDAFLKNIDDPGDDAVDEMARTPHLEATS